MRTFQYNGRCSLHSCWFSIKCTTIEGNLTMGKTRKKYRVTCLAPFRSTTVNRSPVIKCCLAKGHKGKHRSIWDSAEQTPTP